jgi:DNA-binding response OmpR family regulator
LLAEDQINQLEPLHAALSQAGHIVDGVGDDAIAQWILTQREYDLLILDWFLPQVSCSSLCEQHDRSGKTAPVLMLTAKDTIQPSAGLTVWMRG